MIDAQAVVDQVRAGTAPQSWQVYRAKPSYFLMSASGYLVLAIAAIGIAAYILLTGTVFGYGLPNNPSDNLLNFWFIVDLVVLAVFLVLGVVMAIRRVVSMGSVEEQMLVLMPEGFVRRLGASEKATTTVNFERAASVAPSVSNGTWYVVVKRRDTGGNVKIEISGRFGKAKEITRQIQGMYAYFASIQAPAQQ